MRPKGSLHSAALWLCGISMAHVIAYAVFMGTTERWFATVIDKEETLLLVGSLFVTCQGLLSIAVLGAGRHARQAVRGTLGRARVLMLAGVGSLHTLLTTLSAGVVLWAADASQDHLIGGSIGGLLFGLTHLAELPFDTAWVEPAFGAVAAGTVVTSVLMVVLCLYCWFLVPAAFRLRFWIVFDVICVIAFVATTNVISLDPAEGNTKQLFLAIVRLSVSTVAAIRLAIRLASPTLSAIERLGFRSMVAARHLQAKKARFLAANGTLSMLAVAVASCMLVTVLSVMGGFRDDLKQKILGNHAHIVIDKDHQTFAPWQSFVDSARSTPNAAGASPYLQGEVMISSLAAQAGAVLRGIDPTTVGQVTDLERNLTEGKLEYLVDPSRISDRTTTGLGPLDPPGSRPTPPKPQPDMARPAGPVLPGVIVGKELARNLRLVVGDRVHLVSPHGDLGPSGPIPKSRAFVVAGIFYSGMYEYDMKYAYIALETAQRFLNAGKAISGIEVKVTDLDDAPMVATSLRERLHGTGLRIQDWQALNSHLFGALALEKLAMFITLGIAILVAGFSVFGTLTLLVQEKRREVGILKALGTSAPSIIRIFLLEGLLIGLAGAVSGLGLGFVLTFAAEHFGIRMNPEVYYIDKLPVQLDPTEFGLVAAAAVIVCMVATVFPAVQASRVRPVDALRYD